MLNKKLHLLVASMLFTSVCCADDYASPAAFVPVSATVDGNSHDEASGEPMSCKEAQESAWFIRELSRTDGDTNPEVAYVSCGREIVARSTADAD